MPGFCATRRGRRNAASICGAHPRVEAEDLIFQRLEGFEESRDAGIEAAGAGRKFLFRHRVEQPHVFRRAN